MLSDHLHHHPRAPEEMKRKVVQGYISNFGKEEIKYTSDNRQSEVPHVRHPKAGADRLMKAREQSWAQRGSTLTLELWLLKSGMSVRA